MQAKTFPLRTTDKWLDELEKASKKANKSKHEFAIDAIDKEVKETLGREKKND